MNFRLVFRVTGKTLLVLAVSMLLPLLVCLLYREDPVPFLLAIAMTGVAGFALSLIPSDDHLFPREGFFAVALIWLLVGACGALPFYFCGYFESYIDCFFESVSGFTTTGSSILTAVEPLPSTPSHLPPKSRASAPSQSEESMAFTSSSARRISRSWAPQ